MGIAENYDHFAAEYVDDPYAFWKRMREEEPIARSEKYGGFRVLTRYDDILEASQDPERFSSTDGTGIPPLPMVGMIPIDKDPPEQRKYRAIINPALTVNAVAKHADRIRELVVDLVEPLAAQDCFDAAQDLAVPLPPKATLSFIGFPESEHERLAKATDDVTRLRGQETDRVMEAGMEMVNGAIALVEQRRKELGEAERLSGAGRPAEERLRDDDLISLMFEGTFDDRPLEDWEIVQCIAVLLFGAVDTTANAIAGSLYYMATHPDVQRELREADEIGNLAIEELLRWVTPIQALGRTCKRDTEVGGCPIKEGDRVLMLWASGNRDEAHFDRPDEVDLERRPNKHLAFGMGPHRCVGVHMGKLMLKLALEEFLGRVGPFELADPGGVKWVGGESRGIRNLPLRKV